MTIGIRDKDPRLTPARADLAAAHLRGTVEAAAYVDARPAKVVQDVAPLLAAPQSNAALDTELLFGEGFAIYAEADGWAWGQAEVDGYVGYVRADRLGPPGPPITHSVIVPRTLILAQPSLKSRAIGGLGMNAQLSVTQTEKGYSRIAPDGWVFSGHLGATGEQAADFVMVAEQFVGVPYLWGGKSGLGLDCSALVQTAMQRAGLSCPRDSDMQVATIGDAVSTDLNLTRRGDLVFWQGHVGIICGSGRLLHANAHHMQVAGESLADAAMRIAGTDGPVTAIRRPAALSG